MSTRALKVLRVFLAIGQVPLTAYVLACLWSWFVVPLGAPAIGMWHAAGLSCLFTLPLSQVVVVNLIELSDDSKTERQKHEEAIHDCAKTATAGYIVPLVLLGLGRIYLALM